MLYSDAITLYNGTAMAMSFDREYERLNTAQRSAVDTIEGPVLVIAGPGTGKTQLLSMRVANILRRTDVNASNILCLTYTESGQRAIQRRLLELVGEDATKVGVYTFHGFGSAIINANPAVFYDGSQPRAADDLTLFEILHGIFERLPHGGPLSSQNGDEFVFLKNAQERISQLKQAGITPNQLRNILEHDREWCKLAAPLIQQTYEQFTRFNKKHLPLLQELAEKLRTLQDKASPLEWVQPLSHFCLAELSNALETAEQTNSTSAVTSWKGQWLETVNEHVQLKAQSQHDRLEVLAEIYEAYSSALRKRHMYDYDDMILDVLQALENQPDLRASLQEQFQYILVDEYQDTNGAQARILELLADSPVHEDRPNIMVVGDDDQAIYGFQGADASVMLRFRERWREVTTIVLTDNYRSTQPILDTARQLILQGQSRLENYYTDIVKKLVAQSSDNSDKPRLVVFEQERAQYFWLAEELQQLLSRGVAPDSIAIIAPRHKYLQRLLPYLLTAGIDITYERQTNALEDPATRQLMQVLKLIDAISGRGGDAQSLLPEVISYGWWDIAPELLWQLSLENKKSSASWLSRMANSHYSELSALAGWLTAIAEKAASEPLDTVLQLILERIEPHIDVLHLQTTLGSILYGLQQYQPNAPLKLHDLVRYVVLSEQAGLNIRAKEVTATAEHAVHLMTAHKAKGLEFEHVYLMQVTGHIWQTERGNNNKISLPGNLLAIQPAGETADDKLRLLYVAATRAKHSLAFVSFEQAENAKPHTLLGWVAAEPVKTLLSSEQPNIDVHASLPAAIEHHDWRQTHHSLLNQPALRTQLEPYIERYMLSPTHLLTFLDVTRGGPRQFLVKHLLKFPDAITPNMVFGNALHKALEQAQLAVTKTGKLPPQKALLEAFSDALATYSLREVEITKLTGRAERSLRFYLEQQGDRFTKHNLAEQNFEKEHVTIGGDARLTGKIDRLSLNPQTRIAIVTDFKTGKPFTKWQAGSDYDKHKLHRYKQQLLFYKLLVAGSKSFHTYTVNEGALEFVEPDKWGNTGRLVYVYDAAEQQQLEQLIAAVWRKIIELDLPDTSNYNPDFSGVQAFERDLLDGKI